MCKVSDKLKLCICATKDIYKLKHFWVLHRFVEDKAEAVVGMLFLPHHFEPIDHQTNIKTLLQLLNDDTSVFDFEVQHNDQDLLQIAFKFGNSEDHYNYGFRYHVGKWEEFDYDHFTWMEHHEEETYGKIKNALEN